YPRGGPPHPAAPRHLRGEPGGHAATGHDVRRGRSVERVLRHREATAPAGMAADPRSTRAGPLMDADQLVAEIARQTGVRLSTADPILAAAVINELLLDKALAKLDRQVQVQADRVTAASTQAVADAKEEAEALLTEAGAWLEARIKTAGEAAAGMALAELR